MTEDYVRAKIKEALTATGGDLKDTQKLLVTWIVRDHPLLLGFVKPHLKDIVEDRVDREAKKLKKTKGEGKASLGTTRVLGDKRGLILPVPKASKRHVSVMEQIVGAFKKKK